MFVRTKEGKILKCFKSESMNLPIYYVISSKTNSYVEYQDVKKVSENIIDIVEVGDYVNGVRIDELSHNRFTNAKAVATNNSLRKDTGKQYWFENEDIKSIVTKEAFESMSYKVDEEDEDI